MQGNVYESSVEANANGPMMDKSALSAYAAPTCKVPPSQFRVRFELVNRFEAGLQIGVNVDGILCLSREDGEKVFKARLTEIMDQWDSYIKKA